MLFITKLLFTYIKKNDVQCTYDVQIVLQNTLLLSRDTDKVIGTFSFKGGGRVKTQQYTYRLNYSYRL